jgi:subtilisin-like proprotein convertase family protein
LLAGPGGFINDFNLVESAINIPFNAVENDSWVLQPRQVVINNLQHTNLSDLTVNLVHRQFGVDDTTWTLFSCDSLPSDSAILNGMYIFQAPLESYDYDYLTTPQICEIAAAGGIGGSGVVPSGTYRSQEALIGKMETRTLGGSWLLQVYDRSGGDTGQFASWNLQFQLVPYESDCDGDGLPDSCGDLLSFISDCDQDGSSDACQIASQFNKSDNVPYNDPTVDEDGDGNPLVDNAGSLVVTANMDVAILIDIDQNGKLDFCENTSFWLDRGGPVSYDIDQYYTYTPIGGTQQVTRLRPRDGIIDQSDVDYIALNFPFAGGGGNGRADLHDILENPDLDKNRNYVIDSLEIPGDCGINANRFGCTDSDCQLLVQNTIADVDCDGDGVIDVFNFDGVNCVTISWDSCCAALANQICDPGSLAPGDCGVASRAGCSDPACNAIVCITNPACCETTWDAFCADLADQLCGNGNGCRYREYNSADFVLDGGAGGGANTQNYGTVSSTIVVETSDTGVNEDVIPGATLYGAPQVTIYGLSHDSLQEIGIHLVHTSNGVTVEVPLVDFGCFNAPGVLVGDTVIFREFGGAKTVCQAASESGGPVTSGETTFSSAGPLSAFLGMGASGIWTLEITDICCGGNGGFTGWDISFTHTPPDSDGNFIPDVCELP